MEIDRGGWTLFFNYVHFPGSEIKFNENRFPNLKVNSHMYLENAGLKKSEIKEIRFLCTEKDDKKKTGLFWHFKSYSEDMIRVAFSGNQNLLKVTIFIVISRRILCLKAILRLIDRLF